MRNILKTKVVLNQYILFTILKLFLIFGLLLNLVSCSNPTQPPSNAALQLTLEDVSCTEAWLQLTTNNIQLPANINLLVNNNVTQTISLNTKDSLLYIENLLPNQNYKFKVEGHSGLSGISSNAINTQTMDTTSHNFTWQTFTFGQHSSSALYDVAIINENNIWAVGEIYMNRPDGNPDPDYYNAAHWNGTEWELKRIPSIICGSSSKIYSAIYAVYTFSEKSIYFSDGAEVIYFDGLEYRQDCSINSLITGKINKLWGSSSNDLYAVGNGGNIAHYKNGSWKKIESGTELNINDIWGFADGSSGFSKYLAAENQIIRIDGKGILTKTMIEQTTFVNSLWSKSDNLIYTAGDGLTLYKNYSWLKNSNLGLNLIYRVRGEDYNNIAGISANRKIYHFNGNSWYGIVTEPNNTFLKVEITTNIIACVGWQDDKALITIFKRNN